VNSEKGSYSSTSSAIGQIENGNSTTVVRLDALAIVLEVDITTLLRKPDIQVMHNGKEVPLTLNQLQAVRKAIALT
jgi:hypothetical protein